MRSAHGRPDSGRTSEAPAISLACFECLSFYAGNEFKIKWPIELFWRDRKAGGILIENKLQGKVWKWAVVGIGININQTIFNADLSHAVSLKQITGKTFMPVDLAKKLHALLMKILLEQKSFANILQHYNQHLYKINNQVTLKKNGAKFATVIKGVTDQGRLITADASEREFEFGEVEWVL